MEDVWVKSFSRFWKIIFSGFESFLLVIFGEIEFNALRIFVQPPHFT